MTGFRETRLILCLCVALICVVWAVAAVLTVKARNDAIAEGYREAFTSANVFAEQATRTIRLLDSVSQLVAHDLARSPNPNRLKELVDEKAISMDTLVLLSFIDAQGRTVSSNYGPDPDHTDLSDREHVRVQLDHKIDGLYIGKPVLGRVSGRWSIQLSRRVEDGAGNTLGVLVLSIDPHYFERFWSRVTEPSQIVDELVGLDGVLRSRSVDVESGLRTNTRRDALAEAARLAPSGRLETRDGDGRLYLTEFVRLEELPLFVTASVSKSAALGGSNLIVMWLVCVGFAISVLIGLFGLVLASLVKRLRRSTDQARTAERRLADAIEVMPEGFALFDPEDRLVVSNTAYREVYSSIAEIITPGVRFEDLVRHGLQRGQYPEAEGHEEEWLATRIANHRSAFGQIEQQTNTGRWLRIDEKRTSEGGVVGIRYDITELKQREMDFARQTSILDRTLQNIGEAVAAFDSARRLVAWNDNCSRLLDLPLEMFKVGQSFDAVVRYHAERGGFAPLSANEAVMRLATDFHVPVVRVSVHRLADGRSIEARRYPTPDGGAVFVYRDVSERTEYEERRDEALRAAESANRTKSEFLAMISHEIRTPMNAIIGMTSVLAECDLDSTERRYVDVIAESGEKLLVIIDDLLDLSSLEAGKFVSVKSVFDIRVLVGNAVDIARALPQAASVSIVTDVDSEAPGALVADAARIRQIILNLVTNAVKYAGRGVVTIRVRTARADGAEMMLRCEVEDAGPGIPEALRARLFQPFERGHTAVENRIAGTGLGLAICRRLVDMMGGSIGVESAIGAGSRFWFEVPCRQGGDADAAPRKTSTSAISGKRGRRLRVLVAEDVPANQTVIAAMLASLGHEAQIVGDGAAAVEAQREGDFDAILMDIQMPVMNGLDAIRAIRSGDGRNPSIPIIALTAYAYKDDHDAAQTAGATGYITKPIRKAMLEAALQAISARDDEEEHAMEDELTETPPAEFDESALQELREDIGPEGFARLIAKCIEDIRHRIDRFEAAEGVSSEAARSVAHQLRGLFAQFGAAEAARAAEATETADDLSLPGSLITLKQSALRAMVKFESIRDGVPLALSRSSRDALERAAAAQRLASSESGLPNSDPDKSALRARTEDIDSSAAMPDRARSGPPVTGSLGNNAQTRASLRAVRNQIES